MAPPVSREQARAVARTRRPHRDRRGKKHTPRLGLVKWRGIVADRGLISLSGRDRV
jgi:hypothetical protein